MEMICELIRKYLKENGISNRFVAKRSGINEKKLSRLLRGQKMYVEDYAAICHALNVDMNFFYQQKFLESRNATA